MSKKLRENSFIFLSETCNTSASIFAGVNFLWRPGVVATLLLLGFSPVAGHAQGFDSDGGIIPAPPQPWVGGLPPPPPPAPYGANLETPRLLNDTPEYCAELRASVERGRMRAHVVPPDVAMLVEEGTRLCSIGHFRPGIMRLRTALMILRKSN